MIDDENSSSNTRYMKSIILIGTVIPHQSPKPIFQQEWNPTLVLRLMGALVRATSLPSGPVYCLSSAYVSLVDRMT
jgi:hypothetical protein